jgi:hypothetical protein
MSTEYHFLTELRDYYWFPRTKGNLAEILEDPEMDIYEVGSFLASHSCYSTIWTQAIFCARTELS